MAIGPYQDARTLPMRPDRPYEPTQMGAGGTLKQAQLRSTKA